jgi:hypothetical protein
MLMLPLFFLAQRYLFDTHLFFIPSGLQLEDALDKV